MIGKQTKGRSFRGLLNYLESKEKAELIGGNMVGTNARELAAEFRFSQSLNRKVERVVYHASLSLPKHEHLENKDWTQIARKYLNEMGLNYNQYVVYRHHDQDHEHVHIVASRIKLDGSCVHDSWDYRRSELVLRGIEKEYGLQQMISHDQGRRSPTTGERRLAERTGKQSVREKLQNAIDLEAKANTKMTDLIRSLKQQGIDTKIIYNDKQIKGITYSLDGITFSGSQLGRAYTFPGLQKYLGIEYTSENSLAIHQDFQSSRSSINTQEHLPEITPERQKTQSNEISL